ncbi:hypothetical protein PAPYR_8931 [Paratrimastix pyriformis]|uniref:Uncharacterized protein n=1 Tax=Paratrimastix pyriformis TaxID=342808 RepID=A0ABQ8UD65_9EUKA|nr:hypothetical protein PAPYR_8931 [Paratrimastix pyriformis]
MPLPLSVDGEELKRQQEQIKEAFELFATEPTALLYDVLHGLIVGTDCHWITPDFLQDEVDYLKQDQAGISPDVVEAVSFEDLLLVPPGSTLTFTARPAIARADIICRRGRSSIRTLVRLSVYEAWCKAMAQILLAEQGEERSLDKATKMLLWFQDQFVRYPLFTERSSIVRMRLFSIIQTSDRRSLPQVAPLRALIRGLAGPAQPQRAARPRGAKWSLAHCQRAWRAMDATPFHKPTPRERNTMVRILRSRQTRMDGYMLMSRSNSIADRQVKLGWWLIFLNQMVRVYPPDPSTTAFLKHNMHSFILTRASSENVSLFQTFFAGLDDIRRAAVDAAVADPHIPDPCPIMPWIGEEQLVTTMRLPGRLHRPSGRTGLEPATSGTAPPGGGSSHGSHSGSTATLRRAGPTRHRLGGQQQDRASSVMLAPVHTSVDLAAGAADENDENLALRRQRRPHSAHYRGQAAKVAAGARKLGLVVAVERVWLQVDPQTCRVLKRGERVDEPFQQVFTSVLPGAFRLFTNRATWTPYSASSALAASGGGGGGGHLGNRTHASSFRTAGRASTTTLGTSLRALIPEMPPGPPRRPSLAGPGLLPLPGVGARLGQASLKYLPEAVRGSVSGPGAFSLDVRRSSAVPGGIQNLNLTRTSTGHSLSPTRGGGVGVVGGAGPMSPGSPHGSSSLPESSGDGQGGQTQVGPVLDFENTLAIEWDGVTQWTTGCIQRGSRDTAGRFYHVTIHAGEAERDQLVEAITDLARMPPYDEHDFIKEQLHDFIKEQLVNTH